jgi:hypothetical protein
MSAEIPSGPSREPKRCGPASEELLCEVAHTRPELLFLEA